MKYFLLLTMVGAFSLSSCSGVNPSGNYKTRIEPTDSTRIDPVCQKFDTQDDVWSVKSEAFDHVFITGQNFPSNEIIGGNFNDRTFTGTLLINDNDTADVNLYFQDDGFTGTITFFTCQNTIKAGLE